MMYHYSIKFLFVLIGVHMITFSAAMSSKLVPKVAKKCQHLTYCDTVYNYPHKYIASIVDKIYPDKKNVIESNVKLEASLKNTYGNSFTETKSNSTIQTDVCGNAEQQVIYPKAARNNTNSPWVFLINPEDEDLQGITTHVCGNNVVGRPCEDVTEGIMFYDRCKSRCVQKYSKKNLVGLSGRGKVIISVPEYPSCCTCVVEKM